MLLATGDVGGDNRVSRCRHDGDETKVVIQHGGRASINAEVVTTDGVVGAGSVVIPDLDAAGVASDDVAVVRGGAIAADARVHRAVLEQDAFTAIAEHGGAADLGADQVAGDDITVRAAAIHDDTVTGVAADDVGLGGVGGAAVGAGGADEVGCRAGNDLDADAVAQRRSATLVGANVVTFDHVAGRAVVGDFHAGTAVAGDDVPRTGRRAADDIVGRTTVDRNAPLAAGQGSRASGVGADVVTLHDVAVVATAADEDAEYRVAGNDVARRRSRAADRIVGSAGRDVDAKAAVAQRGGAGRVDANVVALDEVTIAAVDHNTVAAEAIDGKALDRAVAGREVQAVRRRTGAGTVQHNEGLARVTGL